MEIPQTVRALRAAGTLEPHRWWLTGNADERTQPIWQAVDVQSQDSRDEKSVTIAAGLGLFFLVLAGGGLALWAVSAWLDMRRNIARLLLDDPRCRGEWCKSGTFVGFRRQDELVRDHHA